MKRSFNTLFVASLTAFVLVGFAMAPAAEAARGGGGGARAGGGGGGGASRQVNNSNRDARANNVRDTSVNNVNSSRNVNRDVSRDVNVDVDVDHHGGWDNDYHPIAAAAVVVGTAAIIGSMVSTVPASCVPINYGGMIYQQCGSTWYQPQGAQYIVVNPPY
jgi:hypothetical protein